MIVDAFPFFNELDLLEIRLNVLKGAVDRWVLVEADRTFQGDPKPLHFLENRQRFAPFLDRIEHVVVTDIPDGPDPWEREAHQRNAILRGLTAAPDDVVLIGDVDEIPRPELIPTSLPRDGQLRVFLMAGAMLSLDLWGADRWPGTKAVRGDCPYHPEEIRRAGGFAIEDGGWHWSWLGSVADLEAKLRAFSHTEMQAQSWATREALEASIRQGKSFWSDNLLQHRPLDGWYPEYLQRHAARYPHLFAGGEAPTTAGLMLPLGVARLAERVERAIEAAEAGRSRLAAAAWSVGGFTGGKTRHLLNNLCQPFATRYLEVGLLHGATFCAALCENQAHGIGIENFSEFDGAESIVRANAERCVTRGTTEFRFQDVLTVDPVPLAPVDVLFYDGNHAETATRETLAHLLPTLTNPGIVLVDDYNWEAVQVGAWSGLSGYRVHRKWHLGAGREGDGAGFWNGLGVFVVGQGC